MAKKSRDELNDLIEEIIVDAYGDDEQLSAFQQVIEDEVTMPTDAFAVGEPVAVLKIDYENERRGLTARCRREDGSQHTIAACDLSFPEGSNAADYLAAYRLWLGIEPYPMESSGRKPKATHDDIDMSRNLELIALAVKDNAISCRVLGTARMLTLRPSGSWETVPGEIITVAPHRNWRYAGHPYVSGEIKTSRLDIPALELVPLKLEERGLWDPKEHYWGEPDEPMESWAKPIIKRGVRPEYEMEQVLPGADIDNPENDPILDAIDLKDAGDYRGSRRILMNLLAADLRCLDAHAHLGNLAFDRDPDTAVRYYDIGVRIGNPFTPFVIGDRALANLHLFSKFIL
jgi:hypothetical protein